MPARESGVPAREAGVPDCQIHGLHVFSGRVGNPPLVDPPGVTNKYRVCNTVVRKYFVIITHSHNAAAMLGQRLRRWPNIAGALCECVVKYICLSTHQRRGLTATLQPRVLTLTPTQLAPVKQVSATD